MRIKIKVLKENQKEKIARLINESFASMLNDPATMAALAGALGIGITALKGILSGGDDSSLDRVRANIKANVAYANNLSKDGRERSQKEKSLKMNKYQRRLAQMKADRAANTENPEGQILLQLTGDGSTSAEPNEPEKIPEKTVKHFAKAKKLAEHPGTDEGTANNARAHMDRFRAMYPEIDNHPSVLNDLYEIFKRFI